MQGKCNLPCNLPLVHYLVIIVGIFIDFHLSFEDHFKMIVCNKKIFSPWNNFTSQLRIEIKVLKYY